MCGVPVHAAEAYLARLIRGGHRVAIAEQTESPAEARKARGSKALVERAIVRLVTAGTLTEETLLESAHRQLARGDWPRGRRLGHRRRRHFDRPVRAGRIAARASSPPNWRGCRRRRRSPRKPCRASGLRVGKGGFDSLAGERALKSRFRRRDARRLRAADRAELAAAGGLLAYLDATQKDAGILLAAPRRIARASHMAIDAATPRQPGARRARSAARRRQPASARSTAAVTGGRRAAARRGPRRAADRSARRSRRGSIWSHWFHEDAIRRERTARRR